MRIFVDMDGTIARFYEADDCLEKMYEIGFFANLRPYAKMIKTLEKLNEKGYFFHITTSVSAFRTSFLHLYYITF